MRTLLILSLTFILLGNAALAKQGLIGQLPKSMLSRHRATNRPNIQTAYVHVKYKFKEDFQCLDVKKQLEKTYSFPETIFRSQATLTESHNSTGCGVEYQSVFEPREELYIQDYEQFIALHQDEALENQTIHIYRVRSVYQELELTAGLTPDTNVFNAVNAGDSFNKPQSFFNFGDRSDYVAALLNMPDIQLDPTQFLLWLDSLFMPSVSELYRTDYLKKANVIEAWMSPNLLLDDSTVTQLEFSLSGVVWSCDPLPGCRFAK